MSTPTKTIRPFADIQFNGPQCNFEGTRLEVAAHLAQCPTRAALNDLIEEIILTACDSFKTKLEEESKNPSKSQYYHDLAVDIIFTEKVLNTKQIEFIKKQFQIGKENNIVDNFCSAAFLTGCYKAAYETLYPIDDASRTRKQKK